MPAVKPWDDARTWRHLPPDRQRPIIEQLESDARDFETFGNSDEDTAYAGDLRRAAAALRFLAGLDGCNPRGELP